jgi:protoheme IX farnesyltransferase
MTTRAVEAPPASRRLALVADYVRMTKPRVVSLLLLTTLGAMLAADRGWPSGWVVLGTMVGGYLSAGGAHAVNQYLDRDIDARMPRTSGRPVAAGRVAPRDALAFGIALAVLATFVLGLTANWLAAGLAALGFALYVGLYTLWLKRSTAHNIVIGGAAGAVPPLVGWAAATGELALGAWLLFAIVFVWTPPHFWALSLVLRDDYARAGVPMLPVVSGERETRHQILWWTLVTVGVSLLPYAAGTAGPTYLVAALVLGAGFLVISARLARAEGTGLALPVFSYSMLYLALLFAALVVDRV